MNNMPLSMQLENGLQNKTELKSSINANNTGYNISLIGVFSVYRSKSAIQIVCVALLLFLAAFMATSLATLHLHVSSDGRVYIHSHPLAGKSDNGGKHSHTQLDYSFLNIVKQICHKLLIIAIALYAIQAIRWKIGSSSPGPIYSCDLDYDHSNRAPPCGLLSPA